MRRQKRRNRRLRKMGMRNRMTHHHRVVASVSAALCTGRRTSAFG